MFTLARKSRWQSTFTMVVMTACNGVSVAHAVEPFFMGLGLPIGNSQSVADGVSEDGAVVVGYGHDGGGNEHAFRWTKDGGMVTLGRGWARAASADGSVVVGDGTFGPAIAEAFRWTSGGGMVGLGDLPEPDFWSEANAVSADGSVVVGVGNKTFGGYSDAFRWTSGGGMVRLGDLPGGDSASYAEDVSADGSVVVGSVFSANGREAVRWTSGGIVGLGDLPGGIFSSQATAVSSDGSVVVGWSRSAAGAQAFRWTSDGGMIGLGDLPGGASTSIAADVSADGSVVVGYSSSVSGTEAFIWDTGHGMRSLRDVLVAEIGMNLTGWTLREALGISADGRTIVGKGISARAEEGWIAYLGPPVPEPSSCALAAIGLASIIAVRLRRAKRR